MDDILRGLKSLSFKHVEMEKRRLTLIEAFENRIALPSDDGDTWILNMIIPMVPHSISQERVDEITAWVAETTPQE